MDEHRWPRPLLERLGEALRKAGDERPTLRLRADSGSYPELVAASRSLAKSLTDLLHLDELDPLPGSLPGLEILAGRDRAVALWSAVPAGFEAPPFLELLAALCEPVEKNRCCVSSIEVLVAPDCPNCPNAVRAAGELLTGGLVSHLHVVDVTKFPGRARELGVASVPVTVSGDLVLTGVRTARELAGALASRGSPAWAERVLAAHLEEGRVERAVTLLVEGSGVPAFASLWRRSSMATRMGLMLAAQTALEGAPHSLDAAVPSLLPLLESGDPPLRGDTAELLSWIGHPSAIPALRRLARDPDPELAAAAAEALEALQGTTGHDPGA